MYPCFPVCYIFCLVSLFMMPKYSINIKQILVVKTVSLYEYLAQSN
jgi:hypothetical protein